MFDTSKYSKDGPFTDPVVRCDSCKALILVETLHKLGLCPECGNRKVRNVLVLNSDEMQKLIRWEIDVDFLALFEPAPEVRA